MQKHTNNSQIKILISMGTCGIAAGATPVYKALKEKILHKKLQSKIELVEVGCMGLCYCEPSIEIIDKNTGKSIIYGNVKEKHAETIIDSDINKAADIDIIERSWYYPEEEKKAKNVLQTRIVLRNTGRINPEKIEDYIKSSGYMALKNVLTQKSPKNIIDNIIESGLRGRGGGGFPTGKKWSFAAAQSSETKYIICNADEGDPGAFMDRAVLEGDPHAVLEAMVIAGYAINANKGYIYIRAEYPLAIKRLQIAITQARKNKFLGKNILNSKFNFNIEIRYGAGAFVCGEETALIRSIEGKRGMPTYKPPFPAIAGLWGKPTIVNNVETLANIPTIIRKGAQWFKSIGTKNSPWHKSFCPCWKNQQRWTYRSTNGYNT